MKKNKLIIFIALLITAGLSGFGTVHAEITQEPQINENNILTLRGKANEGHTPVTLVLYESGTDLGNADFNNLQDVYYLIREVISGSTGNYEFEIPMKGAERQFEIRVKEGKADILERSIAFKNNMADDALKELKSASAIADVKSAVDKFLTAVEFSFEPYENNKSEIENSDLFYKIIDSVKNTEVNSQSELISLSEYAVVIHSLVNSDSIETFTSIFDRYNKKLFAYDSQSGKLYDNKNCTGENVKKSIMQRLYSKKSDTGVYENKGKFRKLLQDSIILSCCEKNRGYSAFDDIIDVIAEIYKNDIAFITAYNQYKSFEQAKKNEIALEIMGQSFSNSEEVINKFKMVVSQSNVSNNAGTGGGNSGGGSSGGGGGGGASPGFISGAGNQSSSESKDYNGVVKGEISANVPQKTMVVEFNDLENVEWAKDSILDLASRGIVNGKDENSFSPLECVTREEFIKMLVSSVGIPVGNDKCDFSDIPEDAWYYKYVAAGYSNGIINGVDDVNFGQGRFISRQDLATMVGRAMKKVGINLTYQDSADFEDDNKISDYAKEIVYTLKASGLINGKENNMFDPLGSTTRAEAAKIISSMIGYIEKSAQ